MHKENLGIFIVCMDIISVVIMAMFFSKIIHLNQEYLSIVDAMRVQMKDFAVRIDDIETDKYTQDNRVFKIKLWNHFNEILCKDRTFDNPHELLDINLSIYTQADI